MLPRTFLGSLLTVLFIWSASAQTLPAPLRDALRSAAARQQLPAPTADDYLIVDQYIDGSSGITHHYLQQQINGLPIHGAYAGLHLSAADEAVGTTFQFLAQPQTRIAQAEVQLTAATALAKALGQALTNVTERPTPTDRYTWLEAPAELHQVARVDLLYYPVGKTLVTAYEVMLDGPERGLETVYVDAVSGNVLYRQSLTVSCQHGEAVVAGHQTYEAPAVPVAAPVLVPRYEVIELPLESPTYGTRTVAINPATLNPTASPNGWHTTTAGGSSQYTIGNNVDCYLDTDHNGMPTNGNADRAFGGAALDFSFPHVPNTDPALYQDAGVTNAFYGINVIHDILYNYGFDRAGGNFEANDGDEVRAEIQDGPAGCNANFATPADGMKPRTQTYICGNRDLAFDNGITFHEFGHGVSNRLTGGPSTASCLFNDEQMGEGWSDYLAIVLTMKPTDTRFTNRTIGNWLYDQPPTGGGIRPTPYTTNMAVNPAIYGNSVNMSSVHRRGYIWCTMLWDMTWELIDLYGFDADIYNGNGGNNRALQLVMTGMKLQACNPGFIDGRDALLAADQALYGGAHARLIWNAFARRGLGYSASQGSSLSNRDQLAAFDLPPAYGLATTVNSDKAQAAPGEAVTFTISVENNTGQPLSGLEVRSGLPTHTSFSGGSGASLQGTDVVFSDNSLSAGATATYSFSVTINANAPIAPVDLFDDFETGNPDWTSASSRPGAFEWTRELGAGYQGSTGLFAPEDSSRLFLALEKNTPFGVGDATELRFRHQLSSENNWDGGFVEITTDGGRTWTNLAPNFTQNGYNGYINSNPATPAYSGTVSGFPEAVIDLSAYAGEAARLRFVMYSDPFVMVPNGGWAIDDVELKNQALVLPLEVALTTTQNVTGRGVLPAPVPVTQALPVELTQFTGQHLATVGNRLEWTTATERNSAVFVVEHRTGGEDFAPLTRLTAAGDSDTPRTYTYTHTDVSAGLHYYRLRQIDLDGSETLSHTVALQATAAASATLLPNPSRGTAQLTLTGESAATPLRIYDLRGRLVLQRDGLQTGTHQLDLNNLPDGVYTVQLPMLGFTERLLLAR